MAGLQVKSNSVY